jgi:hypothetical protein
MENKLKISCFEVLDEKKKFSAVKNVSIFAIKTLDPDPSIIQQN